MRINNVISLNLCNIKKSLSFIPIKSKGNEFNYSHLVESITKINENTSSFNKATDFFLNDDFRIIKKEHKRKCDWYYIEEVL